MPPDPIDHAFARFAERGDPQDLATVFDAVAPGLLRVAVHLTGDPHTAEDLLQETFVAAIEARATFAGQGVEPWLLGILRNRARRAWRARGRDETLPPPPPATARDPVATTLAAELTAEVDAAIQELPETYRPVLRLHLRNQLTAVDIALALERPPGSVRTQIVRGLELLRQKLPRGLAVGALAVAFAPRGLPAVRSAVLEAATAAAPAAAAAGAALVSFARAGIVQKTALVGIAAAISGLATWAAGASLSGGGTASALRVEAGLASGPAPEDPAARPGTDGTPALLRTEVAQEPVRGRKYGTVLVRARWDDDGTPAAGATVTMHAWGLANMHLLERSGTTGPRGTVRVERVPAGEITAYTDVDAYKVVVEPDRECVVDVREKRWARATGTVVDADGKPVAGATVLRSGYFNPRVFPVATTGADGRFAIDVGAARYLGARLRGHVDSHLELLSLKKGETLDVTLRLRGPAASIEGTVRDDGRLLPHALVTVPGAGGTVVQLEGGRQATSMPAEIAETDAAGRFRIDGLEPGSRLPLVVRALDFGMWSGACELRAGETSMLEIELPAGCVVEGRVLDAAGAPVAKAWVIAERGDPSPYPGFASCSASSATDGSFRIDSVPEGVVSVRAGHSVHGKAGTLLRLQSGTTVQWEAKLEAGPSVVGRVVDEQGRPRPGFIVEVQSYDVNGSRSTNQPADAEGRFAFRGLRDEPLRVDVSSTYLDIPCFHAEDVRPGADDLVLTVPDRVLPSARVQGTAVGPDGKVLPGTIVALRWHRHGQAPGFTLDDATGAFRLGPVPPGDYHVVASARGCPDVHFGLVHLEAGANLDLGRIEVGRAGSLAATLRDERGEAIPDEARDHVAILTPDGEHVNGVAVSGSKAHVAALAPGRYLARWGARGKPALQPFTIEAGATTEVALQAGPRATCALTLRETDDRKAERPRDSMEVDLLDANGQLLDRVQLFERDRAGDSWQAEVLAVSGPVTVVVRIEGHERARRTLTLRPGLEIALE